MKIREIARRAKVSTARVSRTINRHPGVQPQLAKRVLKVVEEMGYFPSMQARALVSGRSRIFGLIVSEITNPFFFLTQGLHIIHGILFERRIRIILSGNGHRSVARQAKRDNLSLF